MKKLQWELLGKIQKRFPLVELMQLQELDNSGFVLHLYAPYEDKMGIIHQVGEDMADLVDEGIFLRVFPHSKRITDRAA
jgi:hypothetical protein